MFRRIWWGWYSQGVANPVGFINAFRVRIRDIYKQNWNASLQNSPRARFFRSVVNEHQFYNQLDMLDKKSHRIALARFMASSHRLGVETGRWARPIIPFEQRLCLSALLQLHLHSRLNTWLWRISQRQLQDETRNIAVLWFGASYIRDLRVDYLRSWHGWVTALLLPRSPRLPFPHLSQCKTILIWKCYIDNALR